MSCRWKRQDGRENNNSKGCCIPAQVKEHWYPEHGSRAFFRMGVTHRLQLHEDSF